MSVQDKKTHTQKTGFKPYPSDRKYLKYSNSPFVYQFKQPGLATIVSAT